MRPARSSNAVTVASPVTTDNTPSVLMLRQRTAPLDLAYSTLAALAGSSAMSRSPLIMEGMIWSAAVIIWNS